MWNDVASLMLSDISDPDSIAVQDSGPAVDAVQLQIDSVEEQLMVDPVSYDEVGLILPFHFPFTVLQ